jgi:hypothetical protein
VFGSGWEPGVATIVERMSLGTGAVGNAAAGAIPVYRYVADVKVDGSEKTFRTTLEEPRFMPMFRAPGVGETVKVKVDPKKGEPSSTSPTRPSPSMPAAPQGTSAEGLSS